MATRGSILWLSIAALASLSILVGLGAWQLQRKAWKDDLVATIQARMNDAPIGLEDVERLRQSGGDVAYRRIEVRGRFLHDKERYYYAPAPGLLGWHVYTPLETESGRIVWVNRGFVPDHLKAPETRKDGQVGTALVTGLVRLPGEAGAFTPENDPGKNIWYWRDLAGMHASAFAEGARPALAYFIDADSSANAGGWPKGGTTRVELPNRHLAYAMTWFGLALTLIGVFVAFLWARRRSQQ